MFRVYKNKRIATKTIFDTYEAARQWVRKQLRKTEPVRLSGQPFALEGTPSLGNFKIVNLSN